MKGSTTDGGAAAPQVRCRFKFCEFFSIKEAVIEEKRGLAGGYRQNLVIPFAMRKANSTLKSILTVTLAIAVFQIPLGAQAQEVFWSRGKILENLVMLRFISQIIVGGISKGIQEDTPDEVLEQCEPIIQAHWGVSKNARVLEEKLEGLSPENPEVDKELELPELKSATLKQWDDLLAAVTKLESLDVSKCPIYTSGMLVARGQMKSEFEPLKSFYFAENP